MANGDGGLAVKILKLIFGEVPAQWVRLILIGGLLVWAGYQVRDFLRDSAAFQTTIAGQMSAIRQELKTANDAAAILVGKNDIRTEKLIGKVNIRFERVYTHNGWEYVPIEPPEK